jgi:phenylacetate-CoA ligase
MPAPIYNMRSHLGGIEWPAIPSQRGALLLSLLYQFDKTQWWPAQRMIEHQLQQLLQLLRHAYATVPFYRQRFDAIGFRPGARLTLTDFCNLPLLTRRDIQNAGTDLRSTAVPGDFGGIVEMQTSGSTGEPVKLSSTGLDQLLWEVITLRDHHWHERDLFGKLASIRVFHQGGSEPPDGTLADNWGAPTSEIYATGPMVLLSLGTDIGTQARWLMRHEPDYLLTYPTNLAALIAHFRVRKEHLRRLRAVRTIGETVTPALRAACLDDWGVPLTDLYSSQELGYIALQCPVSGQYHVMAESILVEIIDADGQRCQPGEIGRLVVSKLHNYATPVIRYELRDYAEVGAPCPCGRGLPTLARILGRSRNMLTLPTGEQRWPLVGFNRYREIAPIRQYQLIQRTLQDIEARFVVDRPLGGDEEERLAAVIREALGHSYRLSFKYFPGEIPRGPGGKFEEFVSEI